LIFFRVQSAITIGAGGIDAPLVLANYKQDDRVRCASPIFMLITYYLGFANRNGNMLKKRQRQHQKVNRHRSPQSSNSSQPPDPPHFSLPTTFKALTLCEKLSLLLGEFISHFYTFMASGNN
jgi:hypothetical protein